MLARTVGSPPVAEIWPRSAKMRTRRSTLRRPSISSARLEGHVWHAVYAAQIAAIGEGDSEVVDVLMFASKHLVIVIMRDVHG